MTSITDTVTRQLSEALQWWHDLDRRGMQRVTGAELSDAHDKLAEAIRSVPISCPCQQQIDRRPAQVDLRLQVKHLARVVGALRGFRHGGTVVPDSQPLHFRGRNRHGLFRVDITWPGQEWVTYMHIVNREFKKAGKTGRDPITGKGETFAQRMDGSYDCLRKVIDEGPPYLGDPWKRHAPFTILARQEVMLWVKSQPTHQAAKDEEDILNEFYRGEWSKEGWNGSERRPPWPAQLNRKRARVEC